MKPGAVSRAVAALLLLFAIVPAAQAARVVALAPHLAELVCAAGACDQLVGVVEHSDYPERVRALPRVGDAHAANAEAVLALRPDLIVVWEGGTPANTIARLEKLKLRVERIRVRSLDDVGLALLRLGALLGTEDASCAAQKRYADAVDGLRTRYADAVPIDAMYQLEPDPVFTVNRDSPISEAFAVCGARNVFGDYGRIAGPVGRESVIAANPGAIVFGRQDDVEGIRRGWLRFPQMRAVRANNLIAIDADQLARATPRMAQGIAQLCEVLDGARKRLEALR
ncbi:MAG: cobalamin-binding protein [Steroidobacteraceae bacterium]|nr:cobalamin-binding protein [Steroidobacteraceae bacterium]